MNVTVGIVRKLADSIHALQISICINTLTVRSSGQRSVNRNKLFGFYLLSHKVTIMLYKHLFDHRLSATLAAPGM